MAKKSRKRDENHELVSEIYDNFNKNVILKTENFTIKDNVIIINSENINNYINDYQKDNLIWQQDSLIKILFFLQIVIVKVYLLI